VATKKKRLVADCAGGGDGYDWKKRGGRAGADGQSGAGGRGLPADEQCPAFGRG